MPPTDTLPLTPLKGPVVLCIMDGWGHREETQDNAVALAHTPIYDRLWKAVPQAFLETSGRDVGLPHGQMGNSEVGHTNLGAGRVVMQDLPRIDKAIEDTTLADKPALKDFISTLQKRGGTCHLMGLVSPGGVHAHQDHLVALAQAVAAAGVRVIVHAFLDGRDTPPKSASDYVAKFTADLGESATIGTVCGRYFAMDRDKNWDRVSLAFAALVTGDGAAYATADEAIAASYAEGITDEFVRPASLDGYPGMADGDGLLMGNFRADRARQVLTALVDPAFDGFERSRVPDLAASLGLVAYSNALSEFLPAIFPAEDMTDTLGECVAKAGRRQLRIAETEKYAHVTFFLNGGRETVFEGEERILVPSPKVATYDLQPEMSAPEVTEKVVAAVRSGAFDLVVINFANPDMVGHTGDLKAAMKAVETVDAGVGRLIDAVEATGGAMLLTADHGNAEMMRNPETGEPHTAHTTLPVPIFLIGAEGAGAGLGLKNGRLADVAPTLLALMGVEQPALMTGQSLLTTRPAAQAAGAA